MVESQTVLIVQPRECPAALAIAMVKQQQQQQLAAMNVVASVTATVEPRKSLGNEQAAELEQSDSGSNDYDRCHTRVTAETSAEPQQYMMVASSISISGRQH